MDSKTVGSEHNPRPDKIYLRLFYVWWEIISRSELMPPASLCFVIDMFSREKSCRIIFPPATYLC